MAKYFMEKECKQCGKIFKAEFEVKYFNISYMLKEIKFNKMTRQHFITNHPNAKRNNLLKLGFKIILKLLLALLKDFLRIALVPIEMVLMALSISFEKLNDWVDNISSKLMP